MAGGSVCVSNMLADDDRGLMTDLIWFVGLIALVLLICMAYQQPRRR